MPEHSLENAATRALADHRRVHGDEVAVEAIDREPS